VKDIKTENRRGKTVVSVQFGFLKKPQFLVQCGLFITTLIFTIIAVDAQAHFV
jgi:hypothetical protein